MIIDDSPPCPKCGDRNYKVWAWPNPMIIHWVLNPGLAVNELVLGQRLPRKSLECRSCPDLPLNQRNYVPCPSCHALHDARIWSGKQGFGNWLGIVCPSCGQRIPCLWNAFSLLILAITSPLWFVPVYFYRKHTVPQRPTQEHLGVTPPPPKKVALRLGVLWGGFMFIFMSLVPVVREALSSGYWNWTQLAIGAGIWTIGGAAFGLVMGWFMHRRTQTAAAKETPTPS